MPEESHAHSPCEVNYRQFSIDAKRTGKWWGYTVIGKMRNAESKVRNPKMRKCLRNGG